MAGTGLLAALDPRHLRGRVGHGIEFPNSLEYAVSYATLALLAFSNGRRVAAMDDPAGVGPTFIEPELTFEFPCYFGIDGTDHALRVSDVFQRGSQFFQIFVVHGCPRYRFTLFGVVALAVPGPAMVVPTATGTRRQQSQNLER